MNGRPTSSARNVRAPLAGAMLLSLLGARAALGQSCPPPPEQFLFDNSNLVVLEGLVVASGTNPEDSGHDAAVGIDDPACLHARRIQEALFK